MIHRLIATILTGLLLAIGLSTGMRQAQHGPTNWNLHLDRVVGRVCSDNDFICF
jgi:hypothetical protein